MRAEHRCSKCRKNFFVTEYVSVCQRCVLRNHKTLNKKFKSIVEREKDFLTYMEKWYGAVA